LTRRSDRRRGGKRRGGKRSGSRKAEPAGGGPERPGGPAVDLSGYGYLIVAIAALAAGAAMRLAYLSADPPWDFTWSQALFTDGARAIDGARSRVVFGEWIPDARSPVVLFYPLANLLAYAIFRVGGVGLAQANLVGGVPALVSMIMVFLGLRRQGERLAALVALALLSLSYVHVVYSRVPMVESLQIMLLLGAFWAALRHGKAGMLVSGLLVGLSAFMVKMHSLHFAVVVLAYIAVGYDTRGTPQRRWHLAVAFLGGLAAAALLWLLTVYAASPQIVSKYFKSNIVLSQQSGYVGAKPLDMIKDRIGSLMHIGSGQDAIFAKAPVLSALAFLGLLSVISGFVRGHFESKPWERLAAIWFAGLVAALSLLSYRPLRYLVLLLPSMVLLGSAFVARLADGRPLLSRRKPAWFVAGFSIWLAWVTVHVQQDLIFRYLSEGRSMVGPDLSAGQLAAYRFYIAPWWHLLIHGGAALAVALLAGTQAARARLSPGRRLRQALIAGPLILMVLLSAGKFGRFAVDRRYTIVDTARSLDRILGDGVFLVGDCATTMSLETGFRTLPAYGDLIRYDERETFEKYPVTHFVLRFPTLLEYLADRYSSFTRRARIVRRFGLCAREAIIVRYQDWPGYGLSGYKPSLYEVAMDLYGAGRLEEAAAAAEEFAREHPDSYEALSMLAAIRLELGDAEGALSAAETALNIGSRDALSYEIYGDILSSTGRLDEARRQWERALEINRFSSEARDKLDQGSS
jgi:hypothetical protein